MTTTATTTVEELLELELDGQLAIRVPGTEPARADGQLELLTDAP